MAQNLLPNQPKATNANTFAFGERLTAMVEDVSNWRILNPKVFTDGEVLKMRKLQTIYQREINNTLPVALEIVPKDVRVFLATFSGFESKIDVTDNDFKFKLWEDRMGEANGTFRFQAQEILKICCNFQEIKKERKASNTDPEHLFCQELKMWTADQFCNLEANDHTKDLVGKRIRYLEEILCEDELFDRPDSRVSHTIQQVIVGVRGVLKYHAIPMIEKKLIHADAGAAFEEIMKHIIIIISDCSELLWHALRNSISKSGEQDMDKSAVLLRSVLTSPDICKAMVNTRNNILLGSDVDSNTTATIGSNSSNSKAITATNNKAIVVKPSEKFISLAKGGKVLLHENFLLPTEERTGRKQLIELTQLQLQKVFVGEESGLEPKFRENSAVARAFLKAHAYLLELGNLYGVLEKAKDCALTGGTLLVYGIANAQLNALLELSDHLINSLHDSINKIVCFAETRFGELVYSNTATTTRCPWIMHFKQLPGLLAKIEKRITRLLNEIGKMRSQANSMTLYEQFQKAQKETNLFLDAADGFSKHMSEVLSVRYEKPQAREVIAVPKLDKIEEVLHDEVSGNQLNPNLKRTFTLVVKKPRRRQGRKNLVTTAKTLAITSGAAGSVASNNTNINTTTTANTKNNDVSDSESDFEEDSGASPSPSPRPKLNINLPTVPSSPPTERISPRSPTKETATTTANANTIFSLTSTINTTTITGAPPISPRGQHLTSFASRDPNQYQEHRQQLRRHNRSSSEGEGTLKAAAAAATVGKPANSPATDKVPPRVAGGAKEHAEKPVDAKISGNSGGKPADKISVQSAGKVSPGTAKITNNSQKS